MARHHGHRQCEDCRTSGPLVTLCQGDMVLCPDCNGKRRAASAARRSRLDQVVSLVMTPLKKLRGNLLRSPEDRTQSAGTLDDSLDELLAALKDDTNTGNTEEAETGMAETKSSATTSTATCTSTNVAAKGKKTKKSKKEKVAAPHCVPGCTLRNKSSAMVRCCLCIKWFHPACVGDSDEDAGSGFWNCMDCRKLPQHVGQMAASLEKLRSEVQSVKQLQTSYSKLQASLDAHQKTNQQLVNLLAAKTAECQELQEKLASKPGSQGAESTPASTKPQPSRPIRTGTLLLGDSILRDVDANKLPGTSVVYRGGACVNDVKRQLAKETREYDTVILHVGTNDLPGCLEAVDVISDYRELLEEAKAVANKVLVSSVCPRSDFPDLMDKLDSVNAGLLDLSEGLDCVFVDHNNHFRTRDGGINDAVLQEDGIHLNSYGTNKLVAHLGLETTDSDVTKQHQNRRQKHPVAARGNLHQRGGQSAGTRQHSRGDGGDETDTGRGFGACYKCGLRNHTTQDCRHRSRVKCNKCGHLGHKSYNCQSSG